MTCAICLKQNVVPASLQGSRLPSAACRAVALLAKPIENSMHPPSCAGLFPKTTKEARELVEGYNFRVQDVAQQFKLLRFYNLCADGKPYPAQECLESNYPSDEFRQRAAILKKYLCL